MEDGPQDAFERSQICLPVGDRRESLSFGLHRIALEGAGNPITLLLSSLLALVILPGRYIAMRTSQIPRWPVDLEAANVPDREDSYVRDADANPIQKELPGWFCLLLSTLVWACMIYGINSMAPWR